MFKYLAVFLPYSMPHLIAFLFYHIHLFLKITVHKTFAKSCFKFKLLAVVSALVGEDLAMTFL